MQTLERQANHLQASLELSLPPIAVGFCDVVPKGVSAYDGVVPAGCVFWQEAAKRTFATSASDHELCSIGIHTHNMADAPSSQRSELGTALQAMIGLDYVRDAEIAGIPVLKRQVKHAIYGPLADFPIEPDVVFLFAHARQGLVLSEAVQRVDGGAPPAMGRPACAIVPQVVNQGRAAMSLGCCGARAYLDVLTDSVALWALPGRNLDQYCEQIAVLAQANQTLATFHTQRRSDVEAGARPTVADSLQRLA